jgi:hypothetical protein
LQALSEVGDDAEGDVFDAACGDITDGGIHWSAAVFGEQNSADAEEAGKPEQGAQVLGVLDLVECQPEAAWSIARLQELFEGDGGWGFEKSGAGAGALSFAAGGRSAAVIVALEGDGDGFLLGESGECVPGFGGV